MDTLNMNKELLKKVIEIKQIETKSAFQYPGCEFCAFHEVEPGICEECEDESEFEEAETEDSLTQEEYKEAA
jgi:hypothetical protein